MMHSGHVPPEVVERYTQNLYNQFFKAAQGLLRLHRRAVRVGDIKARLRVGSTKLRLRGDEDGAVDLPPVHEDGATASAQEYALAHLFNPEERQVLLLLEGGPLTAKVISIRLGQTQTPRTPLKDLLRGLV
ncbi:MAG TPA: hypothetical protein VKD72_32770, partial [Gemmataceae bacterium]|nr:hypothetical protein [Gemmataceae bacterium]